MNQILKVKIHKFFFYIPLQRELPLKLSKTVAIKTLKAIKSRLKIQVCTRILKNFHSSHTKKKRTSIEKNYEIKNNCPIK